MVVYRSECIYVLDVGPLRAANRQRFVAVAGRAAAPG